MNVLAVGAHPDDIELGCGAALLAHRRQGDAVSMLVMTTGEQGPQNAGSRVREQEDAAELLGASLYWGGLKDGDVPEGRDTVSAIEEVMAATGATVVYTHAPRDTHQDHRATATATVAACRRASRVLHYEAPTSIAFTPSLFIDAAGLVEPKLNLIRAHVSQVLKNGLVDLEAIEALSRYRGFSARKRFAEGFEIERFVWDMTAAAPDQHAVELDLDRVSA